MAEEIISEKCFDSDFEKNNGDHSEDKTFTERLQEAGDFDLSLDCGDGECLTYGNISDAIYHNTQVEKSLEQQWTTSGGLDINSLNGEQDSQPVRKSIRGRGRGRGSSNSGRPRVFRCEECGKMVDYYKQERHWRTHTGEKPHECMECGKRFTRADILHIHERIHSGERPYQCTICGDRFARSDMLRNHARIHSGEFFKCADCDKCFTRAERLRSHVRVHTGEKCYACPECNRRFSRADNLQTHMKVHCGFRQQHDLNPEGDFDLKFETDSLPSDLKQFPQPLSAPYVCCICNRQFPLACRLRAHLRMHSGEKDFTCAVCGKQFALAYRLVLHMRIHTGERPYHCLICEKSFARAHNLKQHMRSHSGEKPYGCELCGKRYTQTKTLKEHLRIHTGERPFECSVCGKKFARIDNLKVHELTHTDSKRHVCPTCGKKYADSRCFQKHVAAHSSSASTTSPVLPYRCRACSNAFADLRSLRAHSRMHSTPVPSSISADQSYFCGHCGREMTVEVSTRSEIILMANCSCSGDVDESVDGVIDAKDLTGAIHGAVMTAESSELCVKLEIPNSSEFIESARDSNIFGSDTM